MNGVYSPLLVVLSVLVAIFASYTALDLANGVALARGRARMAWLRGFGQLLELEAVTPANRESADQIVRAGKHLLSLIDEVLDISRIESGQISLSVEPVSVARVLHESVSLVRVTAAKQGIAIQDRDAVPMDHTVLADQQRIKQVLLNLLSNASSTIAEGAR